MAAVTKESSQELHLSLQSTYQQVLLHHSKN